MVAPPSDRLISIPGQPPRTQRTPRPPPSVRMIAIARCIHTIKDNQGQSRIILSFVFPLSLLATIGVASPLQKSSPNLGRSNDFPNPTSTTIGFITLFISLPCGFQLDSDKNLCYFMVSKSFFVESARNGGTPPFAE